MARSTAIRITVILCLLAIILGMGTKNISILQASGSPHIRSMVPGRNEAFPYEDGYVVIRLSGAFTTDTEAVLQVFGNATLGTIPPHSQPTSQLATTTVLENNTLKVIIPISRWINTYGSVSQGLSAIVVTNSTGTDIYYFSVIKNVSNPVYYRGGLP